jgi:hypothetical protein
LTLVRNQNNAVVAVDGQALLPESHAKIYWNRAKQKVFADAARLPNPLTGFV